MTKSEILKKLSLIHPEIVPAKDGSYTVLDGKQYVHSLYAPLKEAERLVENVLPLDPKTTLVIFIGAGLGYQIDLIRKKDFKNLIVIEKNGKLLNLFLEASPDIDPACIIGPDDSPEKLDALFSQYPITSLKSIQTITLRGNYNADRYGPYEDRLERLIKVKLGDFATRLNFEEIWFTNILKNIPNLKKSSSVTSLFRRAEKLPVMIISAGPSLRNSLASIKKARPYCVTIAADTALLPLYEAGISPDIVYSLDSQIHNLSDFSMIDRKYLSGIRLVYDIVAHPSLPSYFEGSRIYAANTSHLDIGPDDKPFMVKNAFSGWIETTAGIRLGDIETGGSVSTSAFHLAYLLGGDPILLVGQDLAYTYQTTHSSSTSHFYRILRDCGRLKTIQSLFLKAIRGRRSSPVESLDGKNDALQSDFVLGNFRGWFQESARKVAESGDKVRLLNASLDGSAIGNFTHIDLMKWSKDRAGSSKPIDREKLFPPDLIDLSGIDRIKHELSRLCEFADGLSPDRGIFDRIDASDWPFLRSYFMKERTLFDRYGNLEELAIERKKTRLIKNIKGQLNG